MIMSIVIYFDDGPNEPPFVGCFFPPSLAGR